ncbi:MAG: hypothetical protein CM15mP70_09880 [Pelagibacteraceae bacterium]|nr:MAG: hypothetical protein CM15mP70_09880 [Pelagibacteraceae bacterium]
MNLDICNIDDELKAKVKILSIDELKTFKFLQIKLT